MLLHQLCLLGAPSLTLHERPSSPTWSSSRHRHCPHSLSPCMRHVGHHRALSGLVATSQQSACMAVTTASVSARVLACPPYPRRNCAQSTHYCLYFFGPPRPLPAHPAQLRTCTSVRPLLSLCPGFAPPVPRNARHRLFERCGAETPRLVGLWIQVVRTQRRS